LLGEIIVADVFGMVSIVFDKIEALIIEGDLSGKDFFILLFRKFN